MNEDILPPYFTEQEELLIVREYISRAGIQEVVDRYLLGYLSDNEAVNEVNKVIQQANDIKKISGTIYHDVLVQAYTEKIMNWQQRHLPPEPIKPILRVYRD